MYQCLICLDAISAPGFCWCGRTEVDHKLRASGELFIHITTYSSIPEEGFEEKEIMEYKSRIEKCPHCGWKGMVVPRMDLGCPEHGIWWYKPNTVKDLHTEEHNEDKVIQLKPKERKAEKRKHDKRWKSTRLRRSVR